MMKSRFLPVALLSLFILGACAEGHEKQTFGTVVGAGVGALLGSQVGSGKGQIASAVVGAALGGWLGSEAGKRLDEADRKMARETAEDALENNPSGKASAWNNPDSGHSGSYTPTSTTVENGKDCRDFESSVSVDGKPEISKGRACRDDDGTWRIVPAQS